MKYDDESEVARRLDPDDVVGQPHRANRQI